MKITFKNVGQGDSIILEWHRADGVNVGILDCKKIEGRNPIVQHLIDNQTDKIFFILLSHPHYDHYSGLLELFEFCEKENIAIKYFAHTAHVDPAYFRWFETNKGGALMLAKIFAKSIELQKKGLIHHIGYPFQDWTLQLNADYQLLSLSPSDNEIREYYRRVKFFQNHSRKQCSQSANLLSTVLKITNKDAYILLTSDAEKSTFERLHNTCMDDYLSEKMMLCQIPHHGSFNNHYAPFWTDLKRRSYCPAVVSAGEHNRYNHPEPELVKSFEEMDYHLYATNYMDRSSDFTRPITEDILSERLSAHDELIEQYHIEGDHTFTFIEGRVQEII